MLLAAFDEAAVRAILEVDDVVETYPDDTPYPSALYRGVVGGRPLHVVAAHDAAGAQTIVITVYEPDPDQWDATLRRRTSP